MMLVVFQLFVVKCGGDVFHTIACPNNVSTNRLGQDQRINNHGDLRWKKTGGDWADI